MIRRIDLRVLGSTSGVDLRSVVPRAHFDLDAATPVVQRICEAVRVRGLEAVRELSQEYDGVVPDELRVSSDIIDAALERLDPAARAGLRESIRRLRVCATNERPRPTITQLGPGARIVQRPVPMQRAGLYICGRRAARISEVAMRVVPAQVAGVESVAIASPPRKEFGGSVHPTVLAACAMLGVEEVYAVGGAQAMAMFAYGAGSCGKVDMLVASGNVYTAAALRHLGSEVSTMCEGAGAELAILADRWADPSYVAADFISQVERDPPSAAMLVTPTDEFATDVELEIDRQLQANKDRDHLAALLSGRQSAIVLVADMEQGIEVVDAWAPQRLEIFSQYAWSFANRVRNAGAVFVGPFTPVTVGDYCAGSNSVVPTGGRTRQCSGLSVRTFTRTVQLVDYTREALEAVTDHVVALAGVDALPAQQAAMTVRSFRGENSS
jgi:histidinol dehydrogenase